MAEEAATQEAEEKRRRIAVIDGNALMHRA